MQLLIRDYTIRLITPLFGGGVEAGKPDSSFPIRETSIRGMLRFWWRATLGRLLTGNEMWRREEEIFGSVDFPSPIGVSVSDVQGGRKIIAKHEFHRSRPEAYALFPAIENSSPLFAAGLEFRLALRWPDEAGMRLLRAAQNRVREKTHNPPLPHTINDITPDMEAAIWAWVMFGGLGARTRRGVGAIDCKPLPVPGPARPTLDARIFLGPTYDKPSDAWVASVQVYRDFRQNPRGKLHQKTIRTKDGLISIEVPGRSHWPEADSIRQITGCSLKPSPDRSASSVPPDENTNDHSTPVVPASSLPAFPRAVLGLPINFHFSDGPGRNAPSNADKDPQDVQLAPLLSSDGGRTQRSERMASPVITRPLLWNGNKWRAAVIILNSPHLDHLAVQIAGAKAMADGTDVAVDIPHAQIIGSGLEGLDPLLGKTSAIDALIDHLLSAKYEESKQ